MEKQVILRCEQCNKPFDKQSTLKRHSYYCRSRRTIITPRVKSCNSCARRKARCDKEQPKCSRCRRMAIECQYPSNTPDGTGPTVSQGDNAPAQEQETALSLVPNSHDVENRHTTSYYGDTALDNELFATDLVFANTGWDNLTWNEPAIDHTFFLNPQAGEAIIQYPSWGSPSLARSSTPSTNQTNQVPRPNSSPHASIPAAPIMKIRSFDLRSQMKSGPQRIANLIFHTLKSYPLMMLRHKTFPPFIHPHFISSHEETENMEPLNNCMSLVHMVSNNFRGSRKLFWKVVRMECEQVFKENLKLNTWQLLAAMQAVSIYLLIRLGEGETEDNTCDLLLMATVIAKRLCHSDVTRDPWSTSSSLKRTWRDWIFEESRRRLAVVYSVVNMIANDPVLLCSPSAELVIAPLPAKRQLWEADDEIMWKAEIEKGSELQVDFALSANGELVELAQGYLYCGKDMSLNTSRLSTSTKNWQEWCLGMDGLGGLVMLTASLIA